PSTLHRWQREALGKGNCAPEFAESDDLVQCAVDGVDLWMLPRFEEDVIDDDGTLVTYRTDRGIVERAPKSRDATTMPEHLEYPVKTRADWERLKKRFDASDPLRIPSDWLYRCERWREEQPILVFQGARCPSLFGFVRELLGPERTLYWFYDEPTILHDMMECYTQFILGILPKVLATAPLTSVFFWEDMCYKTGPLVSPNMFREFMTPRYKRITDLLRSSGIDVVFVDSDGDVSELIPLWIEAGINGVYPMEVTAGMDVVKLRRQYGRDLLMAGGIDKRALARGPEAIDDELKAKLPLAEEGGYLPHLDHAVPHDVSYEAFAYYWKKKKEFLGITPE
ncbi:MAG: uroporphyrinogen decarboxylase family protein, partial [Candidatus Zophobacter franzmannii]|nr:uroporphyrinogen decarboxylase family protein [Candidatus Zophobacter franzmannii]